MSVILPAEERPTHPAKCGCDEWWVDDDLIRSIRSGYQYICPDCQQEVLPLDWIRKAEGNGNG